MSKIALITGATAGFGTEICRTLIQAGYFVIGTGRRTERLTSLKAELGEKFLPLAFDISDRLATQEAIKSLPTQLENIDLLVKPCSSRWLVPASRSFTTIVSAVAITVSPANG